MEAFKFNVMGLLSTSRDNCMYRVTAKLNHLKFVWDQPDWDATTQSVYRFQQEDVIVKRADYTLEEHAAIIYIITRYNPETQVLDHNYGFAV